MQRLIVGCGHLGLRVAGLWLNQGDTVYALTRSAERAADLQRSGLRPLIGDVTVPSSLEGLRAVETVLYAVAYSRRGPHTRAELTLGGLTNTLQSLPVSVRQVLYVSSTSVYGQTGGEWIDEGSPCHPVAENGRIGLEAERIAQSACSPSGICPQVELQVFRSAGIYGPGRLIGRIAELRQQKPLAVNPNGWLNLIHVDDCARTIVAGASRGSAGATYVVSDGHPLRRRDFYGRLAELVGAPLPKFDPTDEGVRDLGKRCRNARMMAELQVLLEFPDAAAGLPDAVARTDPA